MIGFTEGPAAFGAIFTVALAAVLGMIVWRLYAVGWGLRE
jgi:hypothetical protein